MEGDSVTLLTNLTEIQTDEDLKWKFPDDTSIIARIDGESNRISVPGNISFRGRLKLNETTGSLTITNIKTTDSGVYKLKISHRNWDEKMEFNVTVRGVFGVDTDGVKSVSVMEGDSVTLHTGLTEIQTDNQILWRFGGDIIPRLNSADYKWSNIDLISQTGDLNIRNIPKNQTGVYEVEINNGSVILHRKFNITFSGVFSVDGVKKRSAMKRKSVTLQTRITSIPEDDVIKWTFGPQDTALVKTDRQNNILIYNEDVTFKDRLQLDTKSGDLTVKNINTEMSGLYKVKIIKRTHTLQKIFSVTVDGVFGVETDVVKIKMSVMEGDSVTLHTDLTEIQTDEDLRWKFPDDTIIARIDREANITRVPGNISFGGRLKLNEKTGSLTITNIKTTDSGVYRLKISHRNWTEENEFNVTVHLKSVSVMEGDSVTLHTDLTEIQTDGNLRWKIQDKIIARIDRESNKTTVPGNTSFEGRLKLNETTGSLTITNIKTTDSGVYQLQISSTNGARFKEFIVTVHGVFSVDGVKKMSAMKGESVILQTEIISIPEDDVIEWTFGPQDTALAKTDRQNNIIIFNKDDVRFKDRLQLNPISGDLTVKNINTEVSGVYKVKIIKRTYTLQKIFSVTLNYSHERSDSTAKIVSGICGSIALVACAVAVFCWKKNRQSRQMYANRDEHRHVWCWGSSGKKGTFHNYLFKKINL